MVSIEYDLRFYRAGLAVLERYLLAKDLYWPPPDSPPDGEPPYQALTLGSVLLARKRLEGREMTPAQQAEMTHLDFEIDILGTRWRTAWGQKSVVEIRARINQWRNFIVDLREHPRAHSDRLFTEARSRVMIELLLNGLPLDDTVQNLREALAGLDAALKAHWMPGEFGWPAELMDNFPEVPFWFLYGSLNTSENA